MGALDDYASGMISAEEYLSKGGHPHSPLKGMDVLTVALKEGPYMRTPLEIETLLRHPEADVYRQSDPQYPERNAAYFYNSRLLGFLWRMGGEHPWDAGTRAILPAMLKCGYKPEDALRTMAYAKKFGEPNLANMKWLQGVLLVDGLPLPQGWKIKGGRAWLNR